MWHLWQVTALDLEQERKSCNAYQSLHSHTPDYGMSVSQGELMRDMMNCFESREDSPLPGRADGAVEGVSDLEGARFGTKIADVVLCCTEALDGVGLAHYRPRNNGEQRPCLTSHIVHSNHAQTVQDGVSPFGIRSDTIAEGSAD